MEKIKIFDIDEDAIEETLSEIYNTTKESRAKDVNEIQNWMATQPHLPEVPDANMIKNFLNISNWSVEVAKLKLDQHYSKKAKAPDLFKNINPKLPHMKNAFDAVYFLVLPKLTKSLTMTYVMKMRDVDLFERANHHQMLGLFTNYWHIVFRETFFLKSIYILDFHNLKKLYLKKISPSIMQQGFAIYHGIYRVPIERIYIVNAPPFVDTIFSMLKSFMKPKLFEKIRVCAEKDLIDLLPKNILPVDYGGQEKSLEEQHKLLKLKYLEYENIFDRSDTMEVREDLRPAKLHNDKVLGFYGSFKKLNID